MQGARSHSFCGMQLVQGEKVAPPEMTGDRRVSLRGRVSLRTSCTRLCEPAFCQRMMFATNNIDESSESADDVCH